MAFFERGSTIKYPSITYSFYPVYANLFDLSVDEVTLEDDFTIDPKKLYNAPGGVIFPNPNAPTSLYLELEAIEDILKNNPNNIVIVDERSEEHTSELHSRGHLVCRLLLEKKNKVACQDHR